MNLSKQEIQYIDNYLQFLNIKFLDVRLELIDHLASEFENNSEYVLLEDFLRTKSSFVRNFEKNLKSKRHWGYQKRLFKRILDFFITPKGVLISLIIGSLIYFMVNSFSDKVIGYLFLASLLVPQIFHIYIYKKPKEMHKKIQSAQYMISIMSLPSLFMYASFSIFNDLPENTMFFTCFWFLAVVFNVAGLQEVILCKRKVIQQYTQLVKS